MVPNTPTIPSGVPRPSTAKMASVPQVYQQQGYGGVADLIPGPGTPRPLPDRPHPPRPGQDSDDPIFGNQPRPLLPTQPNTPIVEPTPGDAPGPGKKGGGGDPGDPGYNSAIGSARGIAGLLGTNAQSIWDVGFPAYRKAVDYYSALLSGNRSMAQAAVSPYAEQIAGAAAGSERAIRDSYLRGGSRDAALAGLEQDKFAEIASLIRGVQPSAAGALGQLGPTGVGLAGDYWKGAGGLQMGIASLLKPQPAGGGGGGGGLGLTPEMIAQLTGANKEMQALQLELAKLQANAQLDANKRQQKSSKWSTIGQFLGSIGSAFIIK